MNDDLKQSYEFCDDIARTQAKNFYYSFRLLPTDRRLSMCALYAFMRQTDDIADEPDVVEAKTAALKAWRIELGDALTGHSTNWPGFAALRDTVSRHRVDLNHLNEVIDGVEMDLETKSFETFHDLYAYCYRVASAVGLCCLSIWGYTSQNGRAEAMGEACGIALQLTNILRDVQEDARNGRVYLPQEDLRRYGVTINDLLADQTSEAARALFKFEADRAYLYYQEASKLARLVEPIGRPVLGAIVGIYRSLLDEIVRRDYNVLSGRIAIPSWKKSLIALSCLPSRLGRRAPEIVETAK
jgi:phytoene synthase